MSPIIDIQRRLHEAGRIRIGTTVPTDKGRGRPQRLSTFRVTSQDRRALEQIAQLYGGEVREWKDAPVGKQWEIITERAELPVAVPPERMALSQSMELWSGGGCVRRCDGERQQNDEPCQCAQLDADDTKTPRCTRHTRLSLMLAELATTGLWRLDTQGFYASEELAGAFELAQMLAQSTGRALLPGWLRLEQREIRRPGQPLKRFPVPVLDLEMNAAALLGPSRVVGNLPDEAKQLGNGTGGLTPIPAEAPVSLKEELQRVNEPEPRKPRKNAAAPPPDVVDMQATDDTTLRATGDAVTASHTVSAQELDSTMYPGAPEPSPPEMPADIPRSPATHPGMRKLFALFNELEFADRAARLDWTNQHLQRTVESSNELTDTEISNLIDLLERDLASNQAAEAAAVIEAESNPEPDVQNVAETPRPDSETGDDTSQLPLSEPAPLDGATVELIWWMSHEAGVTFEWMHDRLQALGVKDPARQPSRATIRRLTPQAAQQLQQELGDLIDARSAEG